MHDRRPAAAFTRTGLLCCALSYALLLSALSPFGPRRAAAATSAAKEAGPAAARQGGDGAPRREGEVIVRFREGVAEESKGAAVSSRGGRRKAKLRGESGLERVEVMPGQDPAAAAAALRLDPAVEFAEPNFLIARAQGGPDDARFGEQWALRNTGQAGGAEGSDVRAAAAWQETTGAPSTVVAVIDSGVDFTHPDLLNQQWRNRAEQAGNNTDDDGNGYADDAGGWDWVTQTGAVRDEQGHGTAVAGVIAAEGNNSAGVAGVMWRASLMSLRVLDAAGTGDVAAAVEAIDYAAAHGAAVVNCSWGTEADSRALRDAIERAGRRGAVVVASAGNSARDIDAAPYYPASFDLPNLVSVASTDQSDNLAQFSNWGAARVGLAAPGVSVLTTRMGGDYAAATGTSISAPLVSGIAGLLKTLRPNTSAAHVRAAIVGGARRVAALEGRVAAGGVADAAGAIGALRGNPYGGSGDGDGGGSGNGNNGGGNGQGQGQGRPYVPPGRDDDGSRGRDKEGLLVTPPEAVGGAPSEGLPNLDESRRRRTSHVASEPAPTIQSNLLCADCDPGGGGGAGGSDPYFGTARTRPVNETGDPGVTLGSRNFNWGLPLVNLRGRAGLDLSLALYYNSLVWTKQGESVQYNADHGSPAPGFQLGLPRLQNPYFDSDEGANAYVMVTPSGGRIQMKQVSTSPPVYESSDGTFTQLTLEGTTPLVRTTDGTQYRFATLVGGERRCTQIKDRNGNFITATYNTSNGHLLTVRDTLGRTVTFVYYADHNLEKITQTWGGVTHTYATFHYAQLTMAPNFALSLDVYGLPPNGAPQTVLSSVVLSGGESYHFDYNAYGQVNQIRHKAPDGHELEHTAYTFDLTQAQTDCPRFTHRRDYAENWNNNAEAVTSYSVTLTGATWTNPETGGAESGTLAQQTAPDGTVYKEFSHASGWDAGLPRLSEVWSGGARKKWTSTVWAQDDTTVAYAKNPRLVETNVYDPSGNRRRTSIIYNHAPYTAYGLPHLVTEYAADGVTALRHTIIEYVLDAAYTGKRVIGLVSQRMVYDGNLSLKAKTVYVYDSQGAGYMAATPGAVEQHDSTGYGAGYVTGRGNLTLLGRFNADYPNEVSLTVNHYRGYNQTGSVVSTRDHASHQTSFDYADSFSDGNNARGTYAYPTKVTDPDGYYSTAQYNFDHGGVTLSHTPTSGTGAGTTFMGEAVQYDAHGRVSQVTRQPGGAYKKWVYEQNGNYVHTYETIKDTQQANEFHSWVIMDGAGRVRHTASDHPDSTGLYSGVHITYDQMGRLHKVSKPTEINSAWAPVGDDALAGSAGGWRYTEHLYDWKGRTRQINNADGAAQVFTYGGCGCAGGDVVTVQDERGRKRRMTEDVLGRLSKVEELGWNGSVYSTTNYTYNTRDQLTEVNQGGQLRSFGYDGLGRLDRRTTPEQGTTAYGYDGDDRLSVVVDARNASKTFGYNNRHLPTSITYAAPAGVAATPNVSFTYDAAGHRTSMTDGHGVANYHYDSQGRMDWESRTITEIAANATYFLHYGYNLSGQLTSVTNHWNAQVSYAYDRAGQVTGVGGANYANVPTYASGLKYRAFGALKQMNFGNGRSLSASYDNLMRPVQWNVPGVLGYNYRYDHFNERTGRVTYAGSINDATLDRSYEYDHVGRLVIAHAGAEARAHTGQGAWGVLDGPFSQGYEYDVWGNQTKRYGWGGILGGAPGSNNEYTAAFNGNRRVGFTYDAAGNLTNDLGQTFVYDAEGRQTSASYAGYSLSQVYDGDRLRVKKTENGVTTYYLRSSVLGGQVVAEMGYVIYQGWRWSRGYVYLGPQLLAVQQGGVQFVHEDPVTKSKRVTDMAGVVQSAVELDPFGADTSRSSNAAFQPRRFTSYERDGNASDEATHRRYNRFHSRFDQPDPWDGSYNFSNPQSFNRYSYTQNDPVNFIDPSGLELEGGPPRSPYHSDGCYAVMMDGFLIGYAGNCGGGDGGGGVDGGADGPTQDSVIKEGTLGKITRCSFEILSKYFDPYLLYAINLYEGRVPPGTDAYTFEDDVTFRPGFYQPDTINSIAVLAEEIEHARQYREFGTGHFAALYGLSNLSWLGNQVLRDKVISEYLERGTFSTARSMNVFELAGEETQRVVREQLEQKKRETGKEPCP